MAMQSINLGAAPNDGTGDSLRVAGSKINGNFTELAASLATSGGTSGTTETWTPQDSGVIEGTGKTAQQRIDNGLNFQAAINYCDTNRKILVVPRGTYEIDLAGGLQCAFYGFRWIGSRNGGIVQYATNTPIITFGQKNTASTVDTAAQMIDGVSVSYGNLVASTDTNSIAVVFSRVWGSDYRNFDIGSVNQQRGNATLMQHGVKMTNGFFFSNNLTNFRIKHFISTGMWFSVQGTGNNFTNIYISNGNLNQTIGTVSSCLSLNANGSVIQENVWNQLNLEWSNAFHAIDGVNARNQVFNSLHVEGVHLRSSNPYFKMNSSCSYVFNGLTLLNCQPTTDEGIVFGPGWDSAAIVSMMTLENFNNTAPKTIHLVKHDTGSNIRNGLVKIQQIKFHANAFLSSADATVIDTAGTSWDQSKPLKELSNVLPTTPGSTTLGDVDSRAYGVSLRELIRFNSPLTANRSLILSAKYDSGSGMTMPNGPTHRVLRTTAATGAFTLTVSTSPNADFSAPAAIDVLDPGQYIDVYFNGTSWIKYGQGTVT